MNTLITIGIYLAMAAGVALAFHEFEQKRYVEPAHAAGAAEQLGADQKVLKEVTDARDAAQKQAKDALADGAACVAAGKTQNDAIAGLQAQARAAAAAAAKAKQEGAAAHVLAAQMESSYLAIVNRPPIKDESCQAQLSKVDKLLRDAAKARQAVTK